MTAPVVDWSLPGSEMKQNTMGYSGSPCGGQGDNKEAHTHHHRVSGNLFSRNLFPEIRMPVNSRKHIQDNKSISFDI